MATRTSVTLLFLTLLLASCRSPKDGTGAFVTGTPLPSNTVTALAPTPEPTITPLAQTEAAPVTAAPTLEYHHSKPACTPGAEYTACYDDILNIDFEYPTTWGEITSVWYPGSNMHGGSGFGYDYSFSSRKAQASAGGRSRDFSQARDGFWTDFGGLEPGQPAEAASKSVCRNYGAGICKMVRPSVVFMISFPVADLVCDPGPSSFDRPLATVAIDLAGGPKINGFVFVAPILSDQLYKQLGEILGAEYNTTQESCNDIERRRQFDAKVKEIKAAIEAGTVEIGTKERINQLLHIAESIQFH